MQELNGIHLNGLRAIEVVFRKGGLKEAAAELGVTPGAVSQQINKAEAQLGCRLFERTPQGLTPTKLGCEVAVHLNEGFRSIAQGISHAKQRPSQAITITVPPIFAGKWLVWRLSRFSQEHPEIRVRIDASIDLVDPATNQADACIRVGVGSWPGVDAEKLFSQRVFPVCAPAFAKHLQAPADLTKVPIIRDTNAMFSWNTWLGPNEMNETELSEGPEYSDAALCLDAAIAGQGVFLAWETLAQDALTMDRIIAPFPGRFRTGISYWFVEAKNRRRTPEVEKFRNWLIGELKRGRG